MLGHAAVFRAMLMIHMVRLLQANRRSYFRLPGSKIRVGMKCLNAGCRGRVALKNGVYQCPLCFSIVVPD